MRAISVAAPLDGVQGSLSSRLWGELLVFAEVARLQSTERAAEQLGLSLPTVERRLRRLQDAIGAKLFDSKDSKMQLTSEGEELNKAVFHFDKSILSIARDSKNIPDRSSNRDHSTSSDMHLPTDVSDHAHRVLDVYAHFKSNPGDVLLANYFVAVGQRRGWGMRDLQEGIERARDLGWINAAPLGWRLTEDGFREAANQQALSHEPG